jgi:hypothetical protein
MSTRRKRSNPPQSDDSPTLDYQEQDLTIEETEEPESEVLVDSAVEEAITEEPESPTFEVTEEAITEEPEPEVVETLETPKLTENKAQFISRRRQGLLKPLRQRNVPRFSLTKK